MPTAGVAGSNVAVQTDPVPTTWTGKLIALLGSSLAGNQFASGGLSILIAGTGLAIARNAGLRLLQALQRRIIVCAELDSRDDSYRWMAAWLARNPKFHRGSTFTVTSTLKRLGTSHIEAPPPGSKPEPILVPIGQYYMWYQGHFMWLSREREDEAKSEKERERLSISMFGVSREPLLQLLREARDEYLRAENSTTPIYSNDSSGLDWNRVSARASRPFESVVLGERNLAQDLLQDARTFLDSEGWYVSRGIPYRRGYMFYGPPGTGKTSFVTALAAELQLPVYMVQLSSATLTDEQIIDLLAESAPRCILLFEDIDCLFDTARGGAEEHNTVRSSSLTFAGLLNAIDGVAAQEGRLLVITTNHPDQLAPALVRPGRIDRKVEFPLCSKYQVAQFVRQFYSQFEAVEVQPFTDAIPENRMSPAQLQGLLMEHRDDPAQALTKLRAFVSQHLPTKASL